MEHEEPSGKIDLSMICYYCVATGGSEPTLSTFYRKDVRGVLNEVKAWHIWSEGIGLEENMEKQQFVCHERKKLRMHGALAAQEAGLSQRESECVFVVGLYKL